MVSLCAHLVGTRKITCAILACVLVATLRGAETEALLSRWFQQQTNVQTWSAGFVQTRQLKTLSRPLESTGQVWFAAPNRFRWELGTPAQTIALRTTNELYVIYPRLKRAERYPLSPEATGPWRDALTLLEAGFPRDRAELESRFEITSQAITNELCVLTLQPKSAGARKLMPQLRIGFATNDFSLRLTELQFADGSTLRNDFTNSVLNAPLDETRFTPALGSAIQVTEPLKRP